MTTKTFTITEKLMQTLASHGRWDDYLESQLIIHGFDISKPYGVCEDLRKHSVIITQNQDGGVAGGTQDDSF